MASLQKKTFWNWKWFHLLDAILETPYLQMYLWLFNIMSHIIGQLHPFMVTIMMGRPDLKLHKRLSLPVTSIKADAQRQGHSPPHCTAILGVKHYFSVTLTHASSYRFNLHFLVTASNFSSLADRRSFQSIDTQGFVVGFARGCESFWDCGAVVCLCVWKIGF